MKLKRKYGKLEDIPEEYRGLYEEAADGSYVLGVEFEGLVDKGKLDEFRENNIGLKKELEKLQNKLDSGRVLTDEEAEQYNKLVDEHQRNKDKKLIDEGKIDELVNQRTERMRQEADAQIDQLKKALDERDQKLAATSDQLSNYMVENELRGAINEVAVPAEGALPDIMSRARSIFRASDGKLRALDSEGNPVYGTDGRDELKPTEFVLDLTKKAPHLFKESRGVGARGSDTGTGGGRAGSQQLRIPRGDQDAINRNLEKIAKGEAVVVD